MGRPAFLAAVLCGVAGFLIGPADAQETKQETKPASGQAMVSPVTQQQLDAADQRVNNLGLRAGNYAPTRFHPARQIERNNVNDVHSAGPRSAAVKDPRSTSPIVVDGVMIV